MAEPVRPLESAVGETVVPGPGPVAMGSVDPMGLSPERALPPERGNRTVNRVAQRVGNVIGIAVGQAKEIPNRLSEVKGRVLTMRRRASDQASAGVEELKTATQQRAMEARNRAEAFIYENPLRAIALAAAGTFVIGFALRIWRSTSGRD